jgi:hypothetical protein
MSKVSKPQALSISGKIFLALVVINGIFGIMAGYSMIFNFKSVLEMNGIVYNKALDIFGISVGCAVLFLSAILTLSFTWTRQRKAEGVTLGITGGGFLVLLGVLPFLLLGHTTTLYIDSIRGLLMMVFGYVSYSSLKSNS